jgi:hypothetical protein
MRSQSKDRRIKPMGFEGRVVIEFACAIETSNESNAPSAAGLEMATKADAERLWCGSISKGREERPPARL